MSSHRGELTGPEDPWSYQACTSTVDGLTNLDIANGTWSHGHMDYGWLWCQHDTPLVEGIMDKSQMKVTVFDLGQVQRKFWGFDMLWGLPEWTFLKRVHCEVWTMDLWQSTLESIVFFCNKKSVCQALLQGQAASAGCLWTFHFLKSME